MDANLKPDNYYAWGQSVDILQVDPYYQKRLVDAYWDNTNLIPLYYQAYPYIYAVSRAVCSAAEPNPSNVILYSCQWQQSVNGATLVWPFPTPESKRMEIYYALAGGAKGLCYWWMPKGWPSDGLSDQTSDGAGRCGRRWGWRTTRSRRSNRCWSPANRWTCR